MPGLLGTLSRCVLMRIILGEYILETKDQLINVQLHSWPQMETSKSIPCTSLEKLFVGSYFKFNMILMAMDAEMVFVFNSVIPTLLGWKLVALEILVRKIQASEHWLTVGLRLHFFLEGFMKKFLRRYFLLLLNLIVNHKDFVFIIPHNIVIWDSLTDG